MAFRIFSASDAIRVGDYDYFCSCLNGEASPNRGAESATPRPNRVRLPTPLNLDVDIVDLLLEERQGQR
jgi:hypothetical protein